MLPARGWARWPAEAVWWIFTPFAGETRAVHQFCRSTNPPPRLSHSRPAQRWHSHPHGAQVFHAELPGPQESMLGLFARQHRRTDYLTLVADEQRVLPSGPSAALRQGVMQAPPRLPRSVTVPFPKALRADLWREAAGGCSRTNPISDHLAFVVFPGPLPTESPGSGCSFWISPCPGPHRTAANVRLRSHAVSVYRSLFRYPRCLASVIIEMAWPFLPPVAAEPSSLLLATGKHTFEAGAETAKLFAVFVCGGDFRCTHDLGKVIGGKPSAVLTRAILCIEPGCPDQASIP